MTILGSVEIDNLRALLAENRLFKALPVMSAFVIATVGAVICYSALG